MKKNKKNNAEVAPLEEKNSPTGKNRKVLMEEIDNNGLTITKSEPAPLLRPQSAVRPQQQTVARPMPQQQQGNPYAAYQVAPQDRDMPLDAALLKPVPGGLQPIIAPKGTVQLSPVVVPVAFVPYSTQNQPLLQYEKKPKGNEIPKLEDIKDQPLDKKTACAAKKKDDALMFEAEESDELSDVAKKAKNKNRVFAAILMVLTIGFFAIMVLNFFEAKLNLKDTIIAGVPNIIGGWTAVAKGGDLSVKLLVPLALGSAVYVVALATIIVELVTLSKGRGYHVWISYLIMFAVSVVMTLLLAYNIIGVSADVKESGVPLIPFANGANVTGSVAWIMTFASALLLGLSLLFLPRKIKLSKNDDDDLSDLI